MKTFGILHSVKHSLFPVLCPACDRDVPLKHEPFCKSCNDSLSWIATSADAIAALIGKDYFPSGINYFNSLLYYTKSGKAQHIFKSIKYWGEKKLAFDLGAKLGERLDSRKLKNACLIPVPLHPRRYKERGYNQSTEIAKGICSTNHEYKIIDSLLVRKVYETSQTHKSRKQRSQVLTESFSVKEVDIGRSSHICLIDDVITTGSTVGACTSLLREAGFSNISILSLAISI